MIYEIQFKDCDAKRLSTVQNIFQNNILKIGNLNTKQVSFRCIWRYSIKRCVNSFVARLGQEVRNILKLVFLNVVSLSTSTLKSSVSPVFQFSWNKVCWVSQNSICFIVGAKSLSMELFFQVWNQEMITGGEIQKTYWMKEHLVANSIKFHQSDYALVHLVGRAKRDRFFYNRRWNCTVIWHIIWNWLFFSCEVFWYISCIHKNYLSDFVGWQTKLGLLW